MIHTPHTLSVTIISFYHHLFKLIANQDTRGGGYMPRSSPLAELLNDADKLSKTQAEVNTMMPAAIDELK